MAELMHRKILAPLFDKLLPFVARRAEVLEARILRVGVPLTEEEQTAAEALGVRDPGQVRLLCLATVPTPNDLMLRTTIAALRLFTPATRGLALRYGIFVRSDCWRDRRLIAHELVHTEQYERLGGIEPFLRCYLWELLTIGYAKAPLEQEAVFRTAQI